MVDVKYMNVTEFCATYGVDRTRLYYMLGDGSLRAIKVGRRTLIDMEHAEDWFSSRPAVQINYRRPGRTAAPAAEVARTAA